MDDKKIAVVTGANRGIGLEICEQLLKNNFFVILTSRDEVKGLAAQTHLESQGFHGVDCQELDVSCEESIRAFTSEVKAEYGRVDVLINNAGILKDGESSPEKNVFDLSLETIKKTFETNTLGAFLMCQNIIPIMKTHDYGRIVNLSSGLGQFSEMGGGYTAYRMSKASLNVGTKVFAAEIQGYNILINSMCPGWVRTDMGGPNATRSVEEGADTALWLSILPSGGPSGKFFRDRKEIPW